MLGTYFICEKAFMPVSRGGGGVVVRSSETPPRSRSSYVLLRKEAEEKVKFLKLTNVPEIDPLAHFSPAVTHKIILHCQDTEDFSWGLLMNPHHVGLLVDPPYR